LIDRRQQRDDPWNVGGPELGLCDDWRQQYEVADAKPKEGTADQQCRRARRQPEQHDATTLHREISRPCQTAVRASQQAPEQQTPGNRAEGGGADRHCCSRATEDRGEALEEVRNEPDLSEEPEGETR
jgi:hypothetical protein